MHLIPQTELDRRITKLQGFVAEEGLDGALLVQNADLFYFAGTTQQAHLFVPAEGGPLLMARKSFERARQESALDTIVPLHSLRQLPGVLSDHSHQPLRRLGMELDVLPANLYLRYRRLFPEAEISDVSPLVRRVRMIKSSYEVEAIRRAATMIDTVMRSVPEVLRQGMTEVEFSGRLEAIARREGHQGVVWMRAWNQDMFYGHVLAGSSGGVASNFNSATGGSGLSPAVPHGPGRKPIQRSEPVLVDYAAALDGYIADQTRMFSIGPLSSEWVRRYEAMVAVQEAVQATARPGVSCADLYELATVEAAHRGYAEHFMGYGSDQVPFVGHGVGIELDELPFIARGFDTPLEVGMVFALEPKVIFPDQGAIGIENTWLVQEERLEPLTFSSEAIIEV